MTHYLFVLLVLGVIFYLVQKYIPMAEPFGLVFRILVAVIAIVLLLRAIGVVIPGVPAF